MANELRTLGKSGSLKMLPLRLPVRPLPVLMITLRNRTPTRTVELFLDCVRDVAKTIDRPRRVQS
jgi:hypothetical protein